MTLERRLKAFVELGKFFEQFLHSEQRENSKHYFSLFSEMEEQVNKAHTRNQWFTIDNINESLSSIAMVMKEEELIDWTSHYIDKLSISNSPKNIAVLMAGNIPMVGFHDMLCVLMSGNRVIAKLSSDDDVLLPFIAKVVCTIEPEFADYIEFTKHQIKNQYAVIATGSNNSARYFDYYFGKYPHIIRKNRNSIAVITGNETTDELGTLGKDVFDYFGLGCRNVSKLFVPKGYNFNSFFESIYKNNGIINNNKYCNNYEYNRTIYLMANTPSLLDNNFLLLKEDANYSSPIGVLFYEFYNDINELKKKLENDNEKIQCIVSNHPQLENTVYFGNTQCPALTDYADGVDTMEFLINC